MWLFGLKIFVKDWKDALFKGSSETLFNMENKGWTGEYTLGTVLPGRIVNKSE